VTAKLLLRFGSKLTEAPRWDGLGAAITRTTVERVLRQIGLYVSKLSRRPITLFLVPEAGLRPYYAAHLIMARALKESGREALILSCNGLIPMCSAKFASGVEPTETGDTNNRACAECLATAAGVGQRYGLTDITIDSLIGVSERSAIAIVLNTYRDRLWEAEFDGISFGVAAYAEVVRAQRRLNLSEFREVDHKLLEAVLHSSLLTYLAVKELTCQYKINRIVYFGDYAIWIGPQLLAKRSEIALSGLDHAFNRDVDRRLVGLLPGNATIHMRSQVVKWPEFKDRPLPQDAVAKITAGGLYRLSAHGGASTYSPNWTADNTRLFEELALARDRKTILAYTSSDDEMLCVQEFMKVLGHPLEDYRRPFTDQDAWLHGLIDWVADRDDIQLVVRVHPRLAATHRHGSIATQAARIKREFVECPNNVRMVWPESPISSYNLAEIANVATVGRSTMGLELARFGVPVVAAFQNLYFPVGGFVRFAEDSAGYFDELETGLARPASITAIREAIRWTNFAYFSSFVDVSDLVPTSDYSEVPPWRTPKEIKTILNVLRDGMDLCSINMSRLPSGEGAIRAEHIAIRSAIERVIVFFASGNADHDFRLAGMSAHGDGWVTVDLDGKRFRRYSPLMHRLISLPTEGSTLEG
jgi:hypothetical protein